MQLFLDAPSFVGICYWIYALTLGQIQFCGHPNRNKQHCIYKTSDRNPDRCDSDYINFGYFQISAS